jgi:hypothetical protein
MRVGWTWRRRGLTVAAVLMLLSAFAVRSSRSRPAIAADPSLGLSAHAVVPAAVMSTLREACFDCHSDEPRRPWYSTLPVAAWLVERDISEGRGQLNFSRWTQYNRFDRADLLDKACDKATKRDMPLWQYRLLHRDARLSDTDIAVLCAWTHGEAARLIGPD